MPIETRSSKSSLGLVGEGLGSIQVDEKAMEEARDYRCEKKRTRREQNALHWAFVVLVWVGVAAVGFLLLAKICHLLLPHSCEWLDKEQLGKIDEFLTQGAIGGLLVGFFKNKMHKHQVFTP